MGTFHKRQGDQGLVRGGSNDRACGRVFVQRTEQHHEGLLGPRWGLWLDADYTQDIDGEEREVVRGTAGLRVLWLGVGRQAEQIHKGVVPRLDRGTQ